MLSFSEYCQLSARTSPVDDLMNAAYGLLGEGGEIVDLIKKARWQGHDLDRAKLQEEIGDALWYVAMVARLRGATHLWPHWPTNLADLDAAISDYFEDAADIIYRGDCRMGNLFCIVDALATIATFCDLTLPACAEANIAKLRRRYPDRFSSERSINRED